MTELQRGVVVVGEQDPLAADLVIGGQPAAQPRIGDRAGEMVKRPLTEQVDVRMPPLAGPEAAFGLGEQLVPERGDGSRVGREAFHLLPAVLPVAARQDVRGGTLEHHDLACLGRQPGQDLDRRGAGADQPDPLADQRYLRVPAGRVPPASAEPVQVLDRGDLRLGQPAGGDDQVGGREVAPGGADEPARVVVAPLPPPTARSSAAGGRRVPPRQRRRAGRRGSRALRRRRGTSRGFGRKENEYRCEGMSHDTPG